MRDPRVRVDPWVFATFAGCVTLTALVLSIPAVKFAYPAPGVTVFVTTLTSMSALSVAVLFFLRQQRSPSRSDAIVAVVFGIAAVLEAILPVVAELERDAANVAFWSRVGGRSAVAVGLVAAAWLPPRPAFRRVSAAWMVATIAVGAATVVVVNAALSSRWPSVVHDGTDVSEALVQSMEVRSVRLATAVLLLAAAAGFARRAASRSDEMLSWLAVGAVLLASARFHDFLYPSMHVDWLTTADLSRVAAHSVLVIGAIRELALFWQRRVADARERERHRLASELHDGLAQELAYLSTQSALAASEPGNTEHLVKLRDAADRALTEARVAIADYTSRSPVLLDDRLAGLARDVESRYGCRVLLDLPAGVLVDAQTAHELGRVAREALGNAARHARSDRLLLHLEVDTSTLRLRIVDHGVGIAESTRRPTSRRFGLTSMHNRAESLGGSCSIASSGQTGTVVEVEVPRR